MTTPAAAPAAAPVLSVTLTRLEGAVEELITVAFVGPVALGEARAELRRWARTAPPPQAYDKCDFVVRWANGCTYRGRYDLQQTSSGSLAEQIRQGVAWAIEDARRGGQRERAEQLRALQACDLSEQTIAENDLFLEKWGGLSFCPCAVTTAR